MPKDIEWLKVEMHKELESWHGVEGGIDGDGINEIMLLINQLDEPEVKQLYKKIRELESFNDELIRDNNQLRNAMDNQEVLSQELPVIPKFVADYLDFAKGDVPLMRVLEIANTRSELPKWEKEYDWISANDEAFARAWLDGYTVEEEQKYNVKFKVKSSSGTVGIFLYKIGDEVLAGDNFRAYYPKEDKYRLTEQEIRDFQNGDILFEHFAVKVEELEE